MAPMTIASVITPEAVSAVASMVAATASLVAVWYARRSYIAASDANLPGVTVGTPDLSPMAGWHQFSAQVIQNEPEFWSIALIEILDPADAVMIDISRLDPIDYPPTKFRIEPGPDPSRVFAPKGRHHVHSARCGSVSVALRLPNGCQSVKMLFVLAKDNQPRRQRKIAIERTPTPLSKMPTA